MPADIDIDPRLTRDRAGIIMFDALNGYLHPKDPVKEAHLREWRIRENMARLIQGARARGLTVFYASGDHAADGADIATRLTDTDMELQPWNGRDHTFNPSSRHGTDAAAIAPEVAAAPGDVIIPKHRWSAFFQTHLDLQFRTRGIRTAIIAGGSSDVGIVSTAFAARDLDYGIVIARDCCYSHRDGNNDFLMNRIFPRMARVMTVDEILPLME